MHAPRILHVLLAVVAIHVRCTISNPINGELHSNDVPVVDLGYSLHSANPSETNATTYTFSNIRYADANRFSAATYPPHRDRSSVVNGTQQSICPQAYPAWQFSAVEFLGGADLSNYTTEQLLNTSLVPPVDDTDEDCLHLDVQIPKVAFHQRRMVAKRTLLPIILWIHGGGYVQGHKSGDGDGSGLITRAMEVGGEGIMWVAINYRLGIFGWLSPGSDASAQKVTRNAGLHDQLAGLRWIQDYAHLFGGDANKITVLSQSAGAGSALIHLATSLAQGETPLFHRAILQSPYTGILPSVESQTSLYHAALQAANVSNLEELRELDSHKLQDVSAALIASSAYGAFTFIPVLDSATFLSPVAESLSQSKKTFPLIVSTNSHEGLLFAAPNSVDEPSYLSALASLAPEFPSDDLANMTDTVYPATLYRSQLDHLEATLADLLIRCNAQYTLRAFPETSYAYQYSVPSGVHAADLHYTFFNGNIDDLPQKNLTVANALQGYIASFALGGSPQSAVAGVPGLTTFGEHVGVDLNITGITQQVPDWPNSATCDGLQEILSGAFA
ncbi:Alpha/Beta hydrolase protein [Hypoxylon crocopeplum]|nr:Alpha/Beta hydrolase protein [Hypoxylon crocopeplum]